MTQFLHGAEVLEIDSGARPIAVANTSVIGIVGTAPDSQAEVKATLLTGVVASNNALTWTSKLTGILGNGISIKLIDPKANSQALSVVVTDKYIEVKLATDGSGVITTTGALLKTAIEANAQAHAIVGVVNTGASTGAAAVAAVSRTSLAGGINEAFPLNVPTLVPGSKSQIALLGTDGTLPKALETIFQIGSFVIVVVRVTEGVDAAATLVNIVGSANAGTGIYAFLGAESIAKACPKILIAPEFTDSQSGSTANTAAVALQTVAERLRAFTYVSGKSDSVSNAIAYRQTLGSNRLMTIYPKAQTLNALGEIQEADLAPYWAALRAKVDNEQGFWVSISNKLISNLAGITKPVDFRLDDSASLANVLNENHISTVIQSNGFYTWGNRSATDDPKWIYECVRRTADVINDSILRAHKWAVDRNITKTYINDVVQGVEAFLADLVSIGAILGGTCWADPDQNTPSQIAQGKVYFKFDFGPTYPAEHITFVSNLNTGYLEELFQ